MEKSFPIWNFFPGFGWNPHFSFISWTRKSLQNFPWLVGTLHISWLCLKSESKLLEGPVKIFKEITMQNTFSLEGKKLHKNAWIWKLRLLFTHLLVSMYTHVFHTTCTFYTEISLITFTRCTFIHQKVSAVAIFMDIRIAYVLAT